MLDREVPLIDHRRLEVLIVDSDAIPGIAGLVDCRAGIGLRSSKAPGQRSCPLLLKDAEGQVQREFFVAASALHEFGDAETTADYRLAAQKLRRPGKSNSWQPIADSQIIVVKRLVSELRRSIHTGCGEDRPRIETEVDRPITHFIERSMVLETQTQVHRQTGCHAPIVLYVHSKNISAKFGRIVHYTTRVTQRLRTSGNVA